MEAQKATSPTHLPAVALSGLAHFLLGASSLYWREFNEISPITLVAYRVILSSATLILIILFLGHFKKLRNITPKSVITHCMASILIAINWGVFIGSSINGYLLESGIGYLLAPFIAIAMGILTFHERLTPQRTLSIFIALSSIVVLIVFSEKLNHGSYLLIGATWGLYTYLKKTTSLDALNGLFLETLFLIVCLTLVAWLFDYPITWPSQLPASSSLIWFAGIVSTAPLIMFSFATNKIPLLLTGLLQFILPLTLLSIGFFFYGQEIPKLSLTLLFTTTGILIALLAYDMLTATSKNKDF
ncbi:hypothetical protein LRQ11_21060 [Pseudomonas sp. MAFF 311095]|uniref:Chloramphenicol-sensitive protein RarD n=1 Tax=Pseudomonas petroselini TaxID=2899822 RepID=A0ABS8QUZ1_9PSED|nr:hypothetical protein [Pseudomonas petroselini]MCD7039554.1 hypothetical protein [Pseudomonas petroselini]MCD7047320.1 hypothetical protein [Pseudomonas petroselini]MCD7069389.1 hypothetical protein [Pseudomonas petroselini]MCD7081174.1 hypothetical protein [Pseudomonas petroselini]